MKQVYKCKKTLPVNDTPHQECRNPGFEQEFPQILQLSVTIKYVVQKTMQQFGK